ncbi:MAG TPA: hypothetical protein VMI92_01410 [Steroidobacteraceae bacterium]|nr:hypothetical protein [Steroidobacteraceae bacterium]
MSAGESNTSSLTDDAAAPAKSLLSNGFDVALLLEALAQVDSARVASELVLEASVQEASAA